MCPHTTIYVSSYYCAIVRVEHLAVPFVIAKASIYPYVLAVRERELCCDFDAVAAFAVREDACSAV